MSRFVSRSQRNFTIVVGVTVVCALLPAGWLPWTAILADIVSVPVQPLGDAGGRVSGWLRPAPGDAGESQALRQRDEEIETTRALLYAARLRTEALLEEIEALQEARRFHPGVEMTPLYARVTGRPPDRSSGTVRINAGSRHGVVPGAIAVYRGGHLVGRVADNVSRLSSCVVPITDSSVGLMEALILPLDDPVADIETAPRIQLMPDDGGALTGDLDRAIEVRQGDIVRLADPAWPDSAQGLIIGTVESIETNDLQPLRVTITVRPRYQPQRLVYLTLIVQQYQDQLGSDAP